LITPFSLPLRTFLRCFFACLAIFDCYGFFFSAPIALYAADATPLITVLQADGASGFSPFLRFAWRDSFHAALPAHAASPFHVDFTAFSSLLICCR